MEIELKSGIYKITNIANGKCYIGSAITISSRLRVHKSGLQRNKKINAHLQRAYNKHGLLNFKFEVLEYVTDKAQLLFREQIWINYFESYNPNFGYNKRKIPNSNLGVKRPHSEETKKKIGEANSKSQLGKEHAWWTIAKMSSAKKGKIKSEQAKENMRLGWIKRREIYGIIGRSI